MEQLEVQQEQAMYIGQNFCSQYYNLFDTNRSQLESMYHKELSIMTFENVRLVGSAAIMAKLVALPFTTVKHCITSIDCHCTIDNTLLIAVLGQLQTDADPKNSFHQTFILKQFSDTLYIVNDIFRLSLHNF